MLVRLREWLYERVLSLPLSFFDKRPAGVLLTRLTNDVDALGEVIGAGIVTIALDILMVAGCLGAMLYLDVELDDFDLDYIPNFDWVDRVGSQTLEDIVFNHS